MENVGKGGVWMGMFSYWGKGRREFWGWGVLGERGCFIISYFLNAMIF